ncbi:MAG: tetratricopeptide repeat protein, partial [Zoogloea sp.]|nr:tetratricopeptide repeat protein [Zoogloea sp.]
SGEASALYVEVQRAAAEHNPQRAREAAGQIIEKYSGTVYADLAALVSAKVQAEGGDLKNARTQLGWAAEHGRDAALRDLARLRLAAVLLDDKAYDEALKQLAEPSSEAFAARFDDLKGDVLMAQNKPADAKAAYKSAVGKLAASTDEGAAGLKELIQAKLESLGGAQ